MMWDDVGTMGMTWGRRGHGVETTETTAMGTAWEPGGYGDDVGTMGMTQG